MLGTLRRELREARDIAIEARTEGRGHQANCVEHNRRIEDLLTEGRAEREKQHAENQNAIAAVHERVSGLKGWIVTMIVSVLSSIVLALLGVLWVVLSKKMGLS